MKKNIIIGLLVFLLVGAGAFAAQLYERVDSLESAFAREQRSHEMCKKSLASMQYGALINPRKDQQKIKENCRDTYRSGWWDVPVAPPRSRPRDVDNGIRFDGCREQVTRYSDQPWFAALTEILKKYNINIQHLGEGCLSTDNTLFIFMDQRFVYKFDTQRKELQRAVLDGGSDGYDFMIFLRFGKRIGGHIMVYSGYGDAGCASNITSAYYFVDNIVKMKSVRSGCADHTNEEAGIQWETTVISD